MPAMSKARPNSRMAQALGWLVSVPLAIRLLLPALIWAATSALYTVVPTGDGGRLMGWLEATHSSLRVFVLDPPAYPLDTSGASALLWALIFAAPLITTAAVADFVRATVLSGEVLAQGYAGHVVVCGAGEHGVVIARRAAREGHKVVILDLDPAHTGLINHRGFQAVVVRGDMTESVDLAAASVQTADHVFFASGDPLVNLRGAGALRRLAPDGPHVHVLADQAVLSDDVLTPLALDRDDIVDQFGVAARTLADLPLVRSAMDGADGRPEVVIIAFGRFGQALLRELQTRGPAQVSVTLVDRKAKDKAIIWNEEHPSSWRIVGDNGGDGMRWANQCRPSGHPPDLVFLCLDNDAMSLRIATTLRRRIPNLVMVLRMTTELEDSEGLVTCSVPRLFDQALGTVLSRQSP